MIERLKTVLFPPFMQRMDERLLLNRPWLWATRIYRVAWASLLLAAVSALLGFLIPINQPHLFKQYTNLFIVGIVLAQIGLFIYWLRGQDAYSAEREQGSNYDVRGFREFGSYVAAVLMIGATLFIFISAIQTRVRLHEQTLIHDAAVLSINDSAYSSIYENASNPPMAVARRAYHAWYLSSSAHKLFKSYGVQERDERISAVRETVNNDEALLVLVNRYSGDNLTELKYDNGGGRYYFRDASYRADEVADHIMKIGFDAEWNKTFRLTFWGILLALAIHISIFRFTFKHTGLKGLVALFLYIVVLCAFIPFAGMVATLVGFEWWDSSEQMMLLFLVGVLGFIGFVFRSTQSISRRTHFDLRTAAQLYALPILLIAIPYILFVIDQTAEWGCGTTFGNYGWFRLHFLEKRPPQSFMCSAEWSLYPLGWWILYGAQFFYLPFLPYLKKQHIRLMSLPKQ